MQADTAEINKYEFIQDDYSHILSVHEHQKSLFVYLFKSSSFSQSLGNNIIQLTSTGQSAVPLDLSIYFW